MKTCEKCGYENGDDALYCNLCQNPFGQRKKKDGLGGTMSEMVDDFDDDFTLHSAKSHPGTPESPIDDAQFNEKVELAEGYEQAHYLRRLVAFSLDGCLFVAACCYLLFFDHPIEYWFYTGKGTFWLVLRFFGFLYVYDLFFFAFFKATPGMMLLGLKIVKSDFTSVRIANVVLRVLTTPLSNKLGIGALWGLVDSEDQMLHEKISGTVTIGKDLSSLRIMIVFLVFIPIAAVMSFKNPVSETVLYAGQKANTVVGNLFDIQTRYEETSNQDITKGEFESTKGVDR